MNIGEAVSFFDKTPPRGEFVLIVEGAPEQPITKEEGIYKLTEAAEKVKELIDSGETRKDAVKAAAEITGVKKNALYRYVLENNF